MFPSSFPRPAAALVTASDVARAAVLLAASGLSITWIQTRTWTQTGESPPVCPAWSVDADQPHARLGFGLSSAGDVNGDGHGDVIVAAPDHDRGQADEGRVYLYLGDSLGLAGDAAWTVESGQTGAQLGSSVAAAGNVDGDGYDDVIVGCPGCSNGQAGEGVALVYLGSPAGLERTPTRILQVNQADARFGESVSSAGDVNGDGYDEVIVGAPFFQGGETGEGRVFVYLGSSIGIIGHAAWSVESNDTGAHFGTVANAGDVDGDGYDDVLVGAPGFGPDGRGRAYLYMGSSAGLALDAAWVVDGAGGGGQFGAALAGAGDVNGDGYDDVLVGEPWTDGGVAYLFLGSVDGLDTAPAWSAESAPVVASAGDVDGDGRDDWAVSTRAPSGETRLYLGSSVPLTTAHAWSSAVGEALDAFGRSAGDVNADGFADLVVGSSAEDELDSGESRVELYLGSSMGLYRSAVFAGDGINLDTIEPIDMVVGSSWSAPLTVRRGLAHGHGSGGPFMLVVRSATVNGPNVASPLGGRITESLIHGPVLARIAGTHDGIVGDVTPRPIANDLTLLGLPWAAQYTVVGGGHADYSQAVYGVITRCE